MQAVLRHCESAGDRLALLDGPALADLNRAGYLEGAYLMLASLHNVRRLMAEKQRRLRAQDATLSDGRG